MKEQLTPEEKLERLIIEGNSMIANGNAMISNGNTILIKLKKTLNGFLYVGIPVLIVFTGSYWHNNNRMTTLESTRMTNEQLEEKFATKAGVVFLQNDIFDMNVSSFVFNNKTVQTDIERQYNKTLKQFTGDITRSVTR